MLPTTVTTAPDTADTFVDSTTPTTPKNTGASLGVYGSPQKIALMRFVIPAAAPGADADGDLPPHPHRHEHLGGLGHPGDGEPGGRQLVGGDHHLEHAADGEHDGRRDHPRGHGSGHGLHSPPRPERLGQPHRVGHPGAPRNQHGQLLAVVTASRELDLPSVLQLTWSGQAPPPPLDPLQPGATSTVTASGDLVCSPGDPVTATHCQHAAVRGAGRHPGQRPRSSAAGDLAYENGTYAEFTSPGGFGDTFGSLGAKLLPAIGNHEAYTPDAAGYWDYFYGAGVNTGRLGDRPFGWYTAAIGSWRFIGLDSECDPGGVAGGCDVTSPQYQWLKSVLEHDTAECTVVAYHKPRWTTGDGHPPYLPMAPIWDLLASHDVDVVVSGHNHVVEAFNPIGVSGTAAQPTMSAHGHPGSSPPAIGGNQFTGFNAAEHRAVLRSPGHAPEHLRRAEAGPQAGLLRLGVRADRGLDLHQRRDERVVLRHRRLPLARVGCRLLPNVTRLRETGA